MPSNIILKKSSVVSKVPVVGDLQFGELALNYADGKLYYKKADGTTIDSFQAGSGGGGGAASVVMVDKGTVTSGTVTFNVSTSSYQRLQVGGTLAIATSGWPTSNTYGELMLELVNGASAAITWPSINWIRGDGTVTTTFSTNGVSLQVSGTDFISLWTRNGGTTIYGKIIR